MTSSHKVVEYARLNMNDPLDLITKFISNPKGPERISNNSAGQISSNPSTKLGEIKFNDPVQLPQEPRSIENLRDFLDKAAKNTPPNIRVEEVRSEPETGTASKADQLTKSEVVDIASRIGRKFEKAA